MAAIVPGPLWTKIRSGMQQVTISAPEAIESWQLQKLQRVIGHHTAQDNSYSRHLRDHGIQQNWLPQSTTDLTMLPTIDKEFLRDGQFDENPASGSDFTIVSTSGSTSVAAAIPHNEESLRVGLGENFARALIAGGIDGDERHWMMGHWEVSEQGTSPGATGSFLSMYSYLRYTAITSLGVPYNANRHMSVSSSSEKRKACFPDSYSSLSKCNQINTCECVKGNSPFTARQIVHC